VTVWLPVIAIAAAVILWRIIGVAGRIWRDRAQVTARCVQMDASAASGAMLCERQADGTTLLVMPSPAGPDQLPSDGAVTTLRKPAA
jgi:hypothetical protein